MQTFRATSVQDRKIQENHFYVFAQYFQDSGISDDDELHVIQFWVNADTISEATHKAYIYLRAEDIEPVNIQNIEIALDN